MDDDTRWLVSEPGWGIPAVRHIASRYGVNPRCRVMDNVRDALPHEVEQTRICRACLKKAGVHLAVDPVRRLTRVRRELDRAHADLVRDWPSAAGLVEAMQAGIDAFIDNAAAIDDGGL